MFTTEEIKKETPQNLMKEAKRVAVEIAKTSFLVRTGQSKANHEVGRLKKYKARLLTRLHNNQEKRLEKTVK